MFSQFHQVTFFEEDILQYCSPRGVATQKAHGIGRTALFLLGD
jgi:hypothetical protein